MLDLEEKNKSTATALSEDEQLNKEIDDSLAQLPLATKEQEIINSIVDAPTEQELSEQFNKFNLNQVKLNALRIIKLNRLLTMAEDQAIERFEKRPDQVSNKELLEYMQVVSTQIERAQNFNRTTLDTGVGGIPVKKPKNEININIGVAENKASRENIMGAVSALLKQIQQTRSEDDEFIVVEENNMQDTQNNDSNIVYSNSEPVESFDTNEESEI